MGASARRRGAVQTRSARGHHAKPVRWWPGSPRRRLQGLGLHLPALRARPLPARAHRPVGGGHPLRRDVRQLRGALVARRDDGGRLLPTSPSRGDGRKTLVVARGPPRPGASSPWASRPSPRCLDNLIQAVNVLGSLFYGPMFGVFLVGFFLARVHGRAAFWATVVGEACVLAAAGFGRLGFLWYNVLGCAVVVGLAPLLQWALANSPRSPTPA